MYDEGVIKFEMEHLDEPLQTRRHGERACALIAWREVLSGLKLIGQAPDRYGGAGFGNLSCRLGPPSAGVGRRAFLVTGTQTAGLARVGLDEFCVVERYDHRANRVWSRGRSRPSSESMTHGAIYDLSPAIGAVLHVHTPAIWGRARQLRIPTTDAAVPYGTPAMAAEIGRLYRASHLAEVQILAMGGHEDGVIAFGRDAEAAGRVLVTYLARAFERQGRERGAGVPRAG